MFSLKSCGCCLLGLLFSITGAVSQVVTGISDQQQFTDQASFQVISQAGLEMDAFLDGEPVPLDTLIEVTTVDYHEITVTSTPQSGGATTTNVVRFIINSSNRGSPERGLIEWLPYPPIDSTAAEFAGARLDLIVPQAYPAGLEIPVVAWVLDDQDQERRANGTLTAEGFEGTDIRIRRGAGSGFLPPAAAPGPMEYNGRLQGLASDKTITIDAATAWTTVSGELPGDTVWPENSRIHFTGHTTIPTNASVTIGAGTIIKLDPGVNITNSGAFFINGTKDQPVVLTATNHVAPEQHTYAWGGFYMRGNDALLEANGAIMVGGGGAPSISFSPGSSHRSEQPVLFIHSGARAYLTNSAILNTAGQGGNGYNSDLTLDRCLIQRAITAGEYVGGTILINHSAIIEFPEDNGEVSPSIADADYDAIYFTTGVHILVNSLFGYCKDDAIDSGSGGAGSVVVSNCWIESALHECLAWSGGGRVTETYHTVNINSGQGIECGWSQSGGVTPLCSADALLSTGNSIGARYGDNYDSGGLGEKYGFLTVTNSLLLYNHRDIWGMVWYPTWNYRAADMDLHDNFITQPNPYHPDNALWNPVADGWRLETFMTTPGDAPVGIGIATWNDQAAISELANGVPVRLSNFTTNVVSVNYTAQSDSGTTLHSGTVVFMPGETVKHIPLPSANGDPHTVIRVSIHDPSNGEITGHDDFYLYRSSVPEPPETVTLMPRGSVWKYHDLGQDLGTAWRDPGFDDSGWNSGPAELGFGDGGEATVINGGPSGDRFPTVYFRTTIQIDNPADFGEIQVGLRRDDGAVIYVNGQEVLRNNMPTGTITYNTFAPNNTPSETEYTPLSFAPSFLVPGENVIAVELHQDDSASSDLSFDLEMFGAPPSPISDTPLISRGAVWKYHDLGQDLGTDWREPSYDDNTWASGPAELGFGDGGEATVINGGPSTDRFPTIYFRRSFEVTNLATIGNLEIGFRRDDGGVVHINGQEVLRSNMPEGPVSYGTYTPNSTPSETQYAPFTVSAAPLVLGNNVIAVEIHQAAPDSSDLSFDLEMTGKPGAPFPPLAITRFGSELLLYWGNPAFAIEMADRVTGPWSEASLGNLLQVNPTGAKRFFRLRRQ